MCYTVRCVRSTGWARRYHQNKNVHFKGKSEKPQDFSFFDQTGTTSIVCLCFTCWPQSDSCHYQCCYYVMVWKKKYLSWSSCSQRKITSQNSLKLDRWQGPPHANKVKQYEMCCCLRSVCLFSLFGWIKWVNEDISPLIRTSVLL